jgi:hypothetical protein
MGTTGVPLVPVMKQLDQFQKISHESHPFSKVLGGMCKFSLYTVEQGGFKITNVVCAPFGAEVYRDEEE